MGLVRGSVCHYCLGRVQCPVRVCAPLAAGLGGLGPVPVLASPSHAPLPAPPPPRCVWRVVPSGYLLPSPAGTPFHAVCGFRGLGPVALLVFPACPLRVCALAVPRRPRPSLLSGSVWRAHVAWFRCRAPVGPFQAVGAPTCFLPESSALSGLLGGGAAWSLSPRTWLWVVCPLVSGPGRGRGGGGLCAACPRGVAGGPRGGGGLLYLGLSLCLPWAGTKAGGIGIALLMEGVVSILSRFVSACQPRVRPAGCSCAPARDCQPVEVTLGAGGCCREGALRMGSMALPPGCRGPLRGEGNLSWPGGGGVGGQRPIGLPSASHGLRGGERGERGGRLRRGSLPPPSGPLARSPGSWGGKA